MKKNEVGSGFLNEATLKKVERFAAEKRANDPVRLAKQQVIDTLREVTGYGHNMYDVKDILDQLEKEL